MNKINFEPIGEAMQAFDTDEIDIGRRMPITNPDGTEGETNPDEPIYTKIPCHVDITNMDNPDQNTVDSEPIIIMATINCPLEVDLQKGDYITARKLSSTGKVLETYSGICGFPEVAMSRKAVQMQVKKSV